MDPDTLVYKVAVFALPGILAITLHEVAHGYVAKLLGDPTASVHGRLTLNPFKHISLVGTILVPIMLLVTSKAVIGTALVFGWAKPVPVNARFFKHPFRDMAWVAVAGPLSNVLMALIWALILEFRVPLAEVTHLPVMLLFHMGFFGISINAVLAILNILPIPPLDGSRVAAALLPERRALQYLSIEKYGLLILLFLVFFNLLQPVLDPGRIQLAKWVRSTARFVASGG